ncbi:hypothetical protein [Paenibacillus sanguinis]|uniref:hypothetical protein n=1 Tax=Paenibacillus sanguinis TaxID=225906 RepID=UPI00037177B8|nr:hypothetical protein [Paenibacillus sanguinis]
MELLQIRNAGRVATVGLLFLCLLIACSPVAKTPEQWFDFTWSGLAGCDELTFRGLAVLQRGNRTGPGESLRYIGELRAHRELHMSAEPASQDSQIPGNSLRAAGMSGASGWEAKLYWSDGTWQASVPQEDVLRQGVARLNPLDQLEEIRQTSRKHITTESAAARGTMVLRIEMDPDEAALRLKERLMSEMNRLGEDWQERLADVPSNQREALRNKLSLVWTGGNEQLQRMLRNMKAQKVYHLTIDRKSGLPARLTSEIAVTYLSVDGTERQEVLRTDNRFGGYR